MHILDEMIAAHEQQMRQIDLSVRAAVAQPDASIDAREALFAFLRQASQRRSTHVIARDALREARDRIVAQSDVVTPPVARTVPVLAVVA